jgi:hypothetical protein
MPKSLEKGAVCFLEPLKADFLFSSFSKFCIIKNLFDFFFGYFFAIATENFHEALYLLKKLLENSFQIKGYKLIQKEIYYFRKIN